MKTIISSLYLKSKVKKAINNRLSKIKIQNNNISFICEDKKIYEVSLAAELQIDKEILIEADIMQWYNIYQFLNMIEEQPIVMELDDYSETILNVKFSQFVARF